MGRAGPRCQAGAPPAEGWRCRHARARVDWSGRGRLPPAVHRARSDMADERRTAAHEMFEADLASRALGIELLSAGGGRAVVRMRVTRSEEHTSELQSHHDLVCRLLLEKKKK